MSHNCLVVLRAGGHKDCIFLSFAIPFLSLCVRWHPGREHSHQDEGDHLELGLICSESYFQGDVSNQTIPAKYPQAL